MTRAESPSIDGGNAVPPLSPLNRLLAPAVTRQLDASAGESPAAWLTAGTWRVLARPRLGNAPGGEEIERFLLPTGDAVSAVFEAERGAVWVPFDLDEAYVNYVSESWRGDVPSRSLSQGQLRAYYAVKRLIPRSLRLAARRAYTRWVGLPSFPSWPLDDSVQLLLRFYALCQLLASGAETAQFRWFWPGNFHSALILTHDVESADGLRLAVELADVEEERGFRSSFNVVARWYPIDQGILGELRERGFEIGLHGLRHDRSLFASREAFERQLPAVAEAARALGAQGFRSPSTHRVHEWLGELPVLYDCSTPHSDPFEPVPGGCCTLWPYFVGDVVELPYTLPQDHTLFTVLRRRTVEPWLTQLEAIEQRFGLVQCLSHPDPGYLGDSDKRAIYAELLDAVAERDSIWKALPRDVATWWRRRDAAGMGDPEVSAGTFRRGGSSYAEFEPPSST